MIHECILYAVRGKRDIHEWLNPPISIACPTMNGGPVSREHNEEERIASGACVPGRNGELVPKFGMKLSVPNRQQFACV